jgi:hypothetical protein
MTEARRSSSLVLVLALAGGLGAAPAEAYRPSTRWLVGQSLERINERGTRSLQVEARVQVYGTGGAPRGEPLVERTWIASPGQLRRETEGDDGVVVEVRAGGRALVKAPGQPDRASKAGLDLLVGILAPAPSSEGPADGLVEALKALGVNTEVTAYGRFDGRVAVVVGGKPFETDQPTVWLDKDTLLPVRVVTFQKGADGATQKVDVRYLGWGSAVGGNWYPASIEVWRADQLVRRAVTQSVVRNEPVDQGLFSLR